VSWLLPRFEGGRPDDILPTGFREPGPPGSGLVSALIIGEASLVGVPACVFLSDSLGASILTITVCAVFRVAASAILRPPGSLRPPLNCLPRLLLAGSGVGGGASFEEIVGVNPGSTTAGEGIAGDAAISAGTPETVTFSVDGSCTGSGWGGMGESANGASPVSTTGRAVSGLPGIGPRPCVGV